ncbi:MAG: sulfate transporter CysZ [Proteobacteria bacterium]|nr:sulfate transporter CysZ [Pseudomonadota bacterium]NOG59359.1 sulfate transporter CysZ [Pseudomonadota bacterium]
MKQFSQGFKYLLSGFKLILKPGIRLYVLIPLLINSFLFAAAIIYGASSLNNFIDWLILQFPWLEGWTWILWPLFVIISLTIVFFCFSIIANLIGAPFNGFLAEAVERNLTGQELEAANNQSLLQIIIISIKSEFQKLLYFVIRALPLLIIFIIPMVNIAAPLIWFLFTAWMLTLEYGDYPMGNHDILFKQQREKFASNRQLAFGFGSGVMLLTMIPVINFIAMPVAVAGATRMVVEHPELKS